MVQATTGIYKSLVIKRLIKLAFVVAVIAGAILGLLAIRATKAQAPQLNNETETLTVGDIVIEHNAIVKPAIDPIVTKPVSKPKTQPTPKLALANGEIQIMMKAKVEAKWGENEWPAMHYILDHESGGNPYAVNKSSGACGLAQALPCSKLLKVIGSLDNVDGQLDWMIGYISQRYSTPTNAMHFWEIHHWY